MSFSGPCFALIAFLSLSFVGAAAQAQAFCINKDNVRLYLNGEGKLPEKKKTKKTKTAKKEKAKEKNKEPETSEKDPDLLAKYTPLMGTGQSKGRYLEVKDVDGKTFWVRSRDVTTSYSCVIVKVNQSRMYDGPGKNYVRASLAEKGQSFIDHGGEDGWIEVENVLGQKTWINMDHVWKPRSKIRMSFDPE